RAQLMWSDFAVLYRGHSHRDELTEELGARGIPFIVAGLNVLETGPVRDLVAVLRCVESESDAVSLFRVAANPHFRIDANKFRAACQAAGRDTDLGELLRGVAGGNEILLALQECRNKLKTNPSVQGFVADA